MDNIGKFKKFVSRFCDSNFDESKIIKIGRNYFYADNTLVKVRDSINRDIYSLGIFLGEEKEYFNPSPACVDMISKMPGSEKRKIFVNKKAEWLFLCGRNILMESIVRNPNNLNEDVVLIQNEKDENLGYGIFQQQGKDLIVKNLLDKGKYLRFNERGRK